MIIAAVLVGCVGVLYGAVWFYAAVINDAPDALDADDLGEIHALPVCEACANDNVIRFVEEDN